MRRLGIPTLILVGEEDEPALEPSRFMHKVIPGSRLVVFPGTGHTLNLEESARFNRAVLDFLAEAGVTGEKREGR